MYMYSNGRRVYVPDENGEVDASELADAVGIDPGRSLILQKPDGSNEIIPRNGKIPVPENSAIFDAPQTVRG